MLKLQMLPAGCGDCLWLEYGKGAAKRYVIIDGGLTDTATALRQRIDKARRERGVDTLDIELLVVTHIDNDHILGIIDLLKEETPGLRVKDIWFNGRPQLMGLPTPPRSGRRKRRATADGPADLMGGAGDADETTKTKTNSTRAILWHLCRRQTCWGRSRVISCRRCWPRATCRGTSTPCGRVVQ